MKVGVKKILTLSALGATLCSGCQTKYGGSQRRQAQLFQEANGPVVVYPIDSQKRHTTQKEEESTFPAKADLEIELQPIDRKLTQSPPQPKLSLQASPPSKETSVFSSELPKRENKIRLNKRDVQFVLKELGHYRGALDGQHGPITFKAVRKFQAESGLVVDGIAGPKTQQALVRALQKHYKNKSTP